MSQDARKNRAALKPPAGTSSNQPWSMDAAADRLMDEVFSDVDLMLNSGGELPTQPPKREEYVSFKSVRVPSISVPPPISPRPKEAAEEAQKTQKSSKPGNSFEKLLLIGACASMGVTLLLWLASSGRLGGGLFGATSNSNATAEKTVAPEDNKFGKYLKESLERIDQNSEKRDVSQLPPAPQTLASNPAAPVPAVGSLPESRPERVLERVYIPVSPRLQTVYVNPPAPASQSAPKVNNPTPTAARPPAASPRTTVASARPPAASPRPTVAARPPAPRPIAIPSRPAAVASPRPTVGARIAAATASLRPKITAARPAASPSPRQTTAARPAASPSPRQTTAARPTASPSPRQTTAARPAASPSPRQTTAARPAASPSPSQTTAASRSSTASPRRQTASVRRQTAAASPSPVAAAPAATDAVSSSPTFQAAAPATSMRLNGLLTAEDKSRSAALFELNGITRRIYAGESIGTSGWTLVEVGDRSATIRRNGDVRSVSVGEQF
jgi:hypothetical protein